MSDTAQMFTVDDEARTIGTIADELADLRPQAQRRIVRYLVNRYITDPDELDENAPIDYVPTGVRPVRTTPT